MACLAGGSSPRERGTHRFALALTAGRRFIPARAGNTPLPCVIVSIRPVHPRASGEHQPGSQPAAAGCGSSPRERGTPRRCRRCWQPQRFIPARAGNTVPASTSGCVIRGSSPRERGTPRRQRPSGRRQRFIPARAGNTLVKDGVEKSKPVHPRASGEHPPTGCWPAAKPGSSPRERGTPWQGKAGFFGGRFIPARAGNTAEDIAKWEESAVHPRASGEHNLRCY